MMCVLGAEQRPPAYLQRSGRVVRPVFSDRAALSSTDSAVKARNPGNEITERARSVRFRAETP